jgi:DNA-directed RNA polymerase subunit D
MKVEILDKKDNELVFMIDGINNAIANTIRRMIISEVPVMAIDEVNFIKNQSALYDEILAHRIGLIPIKTDLNSYSLKDEGGSKATTELKLTLKAKGPKTVYSGDFKSKDKESIPVYDNIPLVNLLKDKELVIEATAILGKGKEHMKFSPGLCYYVNAPINFKELKDLDIKENYEMSKDKFIFFLESWGQMSCKEIFDEAMRIFDKKLDEFSKKIVKAK